jgi:hypothetical protein
MVSQTNMDNQEILMVVFLVSNFNPVFVCSMALPVERLTAEELMGERAERKAKPATMPVGTPGQRLLRDTTLALIEAREVGSV